MNGRRKVMARGSQGPEQRVLPYSGRRRDATGSGRAPIDFMDGGVVHGFDEQFVHVHVWGTARAPDKDVGNVFGGEGV
jgi:hypothetical protein